MTTLFADDTTVYLSKFDKFNDLQEILDLWCRASGAKFNVEKTKIIPVGTPTHQEEIITNRKSGNPDDPSIIPNGIRIAKESEPTRALGAFVRNKVDNASVWTPTLETLENKVNFWNRSNPSQEGRSYITKMEPGGRTQYRTMVQGMPKIATKRVTKIINEIMWNHKQPRVRKEIVSLPYDFGGKKALDIDLRNKAIDLMRLKSYLNFGSNRPIWAYLANDLIFHDLPKSRKISDREIAVNAFLQSWKPNKQPKRSKLPQSIRDMLKTGYEYNITFAPLITTHKTKLSLPVWFHPGRQTNQSAPNSRTKAECLQKVHQIYSVENLTDLITHYPHEKTTAPPPQTENSMPSTPEPTDDTCICDKCEHTRANRCSNVEVCFETSCNIANSLRPKWNPNSPSPDPDKILEMYQNARRILRLDKFDHLFTIDLTGYNLLKNGFRIFGPKQSKWLALQPKILTPDLTNTNLHHYFIDATSKAESCTTAKAAFGIFQLDKPQEGTSKCTPKNLPKTLDTALALSVLEISQNANLNLNIVIHTNSTKLIESLTTRLEEFEDSNWLQNKSKSIMPVIVASLRTRRGFTIFREHNENTDLLAKQKASDLANLGLNKERINSVNPTDLEQNILRGAKLASLTQATIYRSLLYSAANERTSGNNERRKTNEMLNKVREAARCTTNSSPTNETIWLSLRNKNIHTKKVKAFLWKLLHNALPCGLHWGGSPEFEDRAKCPSCNTTETPKPILIDCPKSGQQRIWSLMEKLLQKKGINWTRPLNVGEILTCCLPSQDNSANSQSNDRLQAIAVSEVAWLIWTTRCKWVIDDEGKDEKAPATPHLENIWSKMINNKLTFDIMGSNQKLYHKKALNATIGEDTWSPVVDNPEILRNSFECHRNIRVLVSIAGRGPRPIRDPDS
jgi:hypothetical protein